MMMVDKEIIYVQVQHPRTHLKNRWSSFTDYEIRVSTKNRAFLLYNSCVRRRFSEVEWLKRTLEKSSSLTSNLPPFPSKRVFISRFNRDFLEKRRALLEEFLTRLVNTTTFLSESALHLFLQTNLKVKEIERILEGKDCRNITDFVSQEEHLDGRVLRQKSTCTDSGFSESTNLDRHLPDCVLQYQGTGNGWSSGCTYTNFTRRKKAIYKGRCLGCRRKSLCRTASVLPSGQLLIAENELEEVQDAGSVGSSERCRKEDCAKCNQYDADDESDTHVLDYDIINAKTFRLRNWLAAVKPFPSDTELLTSEDECVPESRTIPEYDIISIPCLSISMASMSLHKDKANSRRNKKYKSSDDSEYSVVHSTIGGLELGTSKQLYDSSSSLSSAGVYRTYDIVEMVELQ